MQSNPVSHLPQKSLVHMPTVAVVGDSLAAAMVAQVQQQYPLWVNDGSRGQETSGSVLNRLPAILATHPDVVVILAGTFDIANVNWDQPCGSTDQDTALGIDTCDNLLQMIALSQSAGSKVILCTIPLTTEATLLNANPDMLGNEDLYDRNLRLVTGFQAPGWTEDGLVDLEAALVGVTWTDDGLLPNSSGAQAMASVIAAQIAQFDVGGTKVSNLIRMNK